MKLLLTFMIVISYLNAGNYANSISTNEIDNLINQPKYKFVGEIKNKSGFKNGNCFVINENTLICCASSLQNVVTQSDTLVVNGKKIISLIEISRNWIDKSDLKIVINEKEYSIENIIINPDFDWKSTNSVDIAIIIIKELVNAKYPQLSVSKIEEKKLISIIGLSNSGIYGTNIVESSFESGNYNYITINLSPNTNGQTKFEFIPADEDRGFALISESENDIILTGLYQYNRLKNESVFLDLFSLDSWLKSNIISQITK